MKGRAGGKGKAWRKKGKGDHKKHTQAGKVDFRRVVKWQITATWTSTFMDIRCLRSNSLQEPSGPQLWLSLTLAGVWPQPWPLLCQGKEENSGSQADN